VNVFEPPPPDFNSIIFDYDSISTAVAVDDDLSDFLIFFFLLFLGLVDFLLLRFHLDSFSSEFWMDYYYYYYYYYYYDDDDYYY